MRYRIVHLSTHNTNIGDGALNSAIQKSLKAELAEITFEDQDLMEFSNYFGSKQFDHDYVKYINTNCNMLIVGGGGMIDGTGGHRASGLGFNLEPELLQKITVPIVFYGLGFNLFPGQRFEHLDRLRKTLLAVENMPNALFSVRFDDSLHRLRQITDMPLNSVLEVPDPGFFVEARDCPHIELDSDRKNVVLQLAGDRLSERLGLPSFLRSVGPLVRRRERHFLREIYRSLKRISDARNVNFILCPHLVRDLSVTASFVGVCKKSFARYHIAVSPIVRGTAKSGEFFDLYRKADLVVGMRGHSSICAVGLGTPHICLASHDKATGFMRRAGLDAYSIEISDGALASKLETLILSLLDDASDYAERQQAFWRESLAVHREFTRKIVRKMIES